MVPNNDFPSSTSIRVGSTDVFPVNTVRNLGSSLTRTCQFRRRLTSWAVRPSFISIIYAFITSRLDYCNSRLYGLLSTEISKLQRVQNAAARLVTCYSKFSHVTPVLYQLYWLPVRFRIFFKVLLIVYKSLLGQSPQYISNLISVRN